MFFAITMLVADGMTERFAAAKPAHDAYRNSFADRVVSANSLIDEHGKSMGLRCIIKADSVVSAAAFVEGDPMTSSGSLASIEIVEWTRAEPKLL